MIREMVMFSIPEAVAVTWLAYALSGGKLYWQKVLSIGILMGIMSALLRPYATSFLLNMLIYAAILVTLFKIFKVTALWESLTSVAIAIPIYLLTEFLNITVINTLNIDPTQFANDLTLKFLCFLPQLAVTMAMAFVLSRFKFALFFEENQEV